jgi:hypothetical protein
MAQIQPIDFPFTGEATQLKVLILNFETTASTCTTYNELLTEDYTLTDEEFTAWGEDNAWVENCVAKDKNITILNY